MVNIGTAKMVGTLKAATYVWPNPELIGKKALVAEIDTESLIEKLSCVAAQFDDVEEFKFGWHIFSRHCFEPVLTEGEATNETNK